MKAAPGSVEVLLATLRLTYSSGVLVWKLECSADVPVKLPCGFNKCVSNKLHLVLATTYCS